MAQVSSTHLFGSGRLITGPTDLGTPGTPAVYGGTGLGTVQNLKLLITRKIDPITAEEYGGAPVDGVVLDEEVILEATFSGWDEDAINALFYNASTNSGVPTLTFPTAPGTLVDGVAQKLLWVSRDESTKPSFLAYRAVPWRVPRPVFFSARNATMLTASWLLLRDSSERVFESNLLASLSL